MGFFLSWSHIGWDSWFFEAKLGESRRNRDGWTVYLDETSERLSQREVKNKMDKEFSSSIHTSLGKCQNHCHDLSYNVQVLATKYKNKESNFESLQELVKLLKLPKDWKTWIKMKLAPLGTCNVTDLTHQKPLEVTECFYFKQKPLMKLLQFSI